MHFRPLREEEFEREALPAFRRIFRTEDPYDEPVDPAVEARTLLFPVGYELGQTEIAALLGAAAVVQDEGFFFSVLERPPAEEQDRPYHWYIPLHEIGRYRDLGYPFVLQNALYSRGVNGV